MINHCGLVKGLGFVIGSAINFSTNCAVAQILPDTTLPTNSQVITQENITTITGGTLAGSNLFHSFEQFSVPDKGIAEFQYIGQVQNIISRVTGNSISHIYGTLKADGINLFLINPNGIVFGPNASLQIGGSFVASTASSVNFEDGTKFSTTEPQTTPLLTVSVPIGLQFGATAAPIRNESQVGLQVEPSKTLALLGGDVTLEGGNLTAPSGRIELGSVAANSLVKLTSTDQSWNLGYEGVQNFQNIQLIERISDDSKIPSVVNTNGPDGGSIQVQGKEVLLSGHNVFLRSVTRVGIGKDITITAEKLIVENGARISNNSIGTGSAGNLTVNASESVELIGSTTEQGGLTGLFSITGSTGNAGNITIKTRKLRIQDEARLSAESSAVSDSNTRLVLAEGNAGNITVNALESVELAGKGQLFASTLYKGDAGIVNITTGKLIVRDGALINVGVAANDLKTTSNLATPGQINVTARSILLDNGGVLQAGSSSGPGGNITLQVQDLLLMRRESQISASAGAANAPGNGGNITINAPNGFVVAAPLENNDITANAFSGSGGKITIDTQKIFGFVLRTGEELERLLKPKEPKKLDSSGLPTNDITVFSQENRSLSGTIEINTADVDPSKGLIELPINLVDVSQQIATDCNPGGKLGKGSFIATGRGGIAPSPREPLMSNDVVRADWLKLGSERENRAGDVQNRVVIQQQRHAEDNTQKAEFANSPTAIVEAQGWVIDTNGNVVLVAQAPTVTPHSPSLASPSCAVN
ncbi:filamentous hemagglutinin family N-terminal domain protein [Cylindrospermum stagnale PCC 7417]|uniref:Filamentous hemagglutinin family N-terminal domain protein n=1 Tax=Cylindrospermum stagnale PCC 7417 TaxID=56107 RepID=K9WRV7_9NOST|nr:filamentous hemagglutinin N-terminal domain-containing protein [Cylindrospermum stagnale]AFZ23095.1 filamentous hemagglutinin family N-terminal domain protein [Cylindrospermum stagnale PCC 7417]